MHNRSDIEFHGLIGDRDIRHPGHNALWIRLDHSSAVPHEHMYERSRVPPWQVSKSLGCI